MSLQVIGAGWGRTGTESLKLALEQLGFGKCYHFFDLLKDDRKISYWEQLQRGEKPDYDTMFKGYQSTVSSLSACYYKELMEEYPEAKVVLTVRDTDEWYASAEKTVFKKAPRALYPVSRALGLVSKRFNHLARVLKFSDDFLYNGLYRGKSGDKEFMKSLFNNWNNEVKKEVPEDRLLVYNIKEGWEPLCNFLKVPIPKNEFPMSNERTDFRKNVRSYFLKKNTRSE